MYITTDAYREWVYGSHHGHCGAAAGIPISHVTGIPNIPLAHVDMTVNAAVPIYSNSLAILEMQGLTPRSVHPVHWPGLKCKASPRIARGN
jgi:hypothetical protein